MPRFQVEVAIVLVLSVGISLLVFGLTRSREGKIHLPVQDDSGSIEELDGGQHEDPYEVTKPEDYLDGYPIDEQAFWKRVKLRKVTLGSIFTAILVLQTISFGWAAATADGEGIAVYVFNMLFALYLLWMTVRSVSQTEMQPHTESMIHLSALTFVCVVLIAFTAITPDDDTPIISSVSASTAPALRGLWYTTLALYFISMLIASRMPLGPRLHFPPNQIYSDKVIESTTNFAEDNVCGVAVASVWSCLLFSYTTSVVMLGNTATSLEIGDLPIVPANMRATVLYARMKHAMKGVKLRIRNWRPEIGRGWDLGYRLLRLNRGIYAAEMILASVAACLFYAPAFFFQRVIQYLEDDPTRENRSWGLFWVTGLLFVNCFAYIVTGQLWSLATTTIQVRMRIQLNSVLFAKTLVRKDVASSGSTSDKDKDKDQKPAAAQPAAEDVSTGKDESKKNDEENDFSSKAQIMTLMTTDVDRLSEFPWHVFSIVDSPIEIAIGTLFLYKLLGVSCFVGLAVTCLFLPLNHFAGKIVVRAQESLMKARDERVALMNEILGAIRMLKFMAWERSFEARVNKIRDKELKYQKLNYTIETVWNAIWNGSPIIVTLVSFWHFTMIRKQVLSPSIAFTSITIFTEMKFALNALPETFINMLQSFVSLRRIEKYLHGAEVKAVPPTDEQPRTIAFQSATVTWAQDRPQSSATPSAASTPKHKFILTDLSLIFPQGEMTLICGKLGSGKTLLLLALLGEADLLAGQLLCPRSPPDAIAKFTEEKNVPEKDWVVPGICAYVPQTAWLRNASIKDNILFNLPLNEERYQRTLEVCALVSDLKILEDGDDSEIGERGVNVSGGQKARISLARAVYSRASILLLDDVLSAVDAHTAHHIYTECLKGDLMENRTIILVSHHVQLCSPGAKFIVALDNGRVQFAGDRAGFEASGALNTLVQSTPEDRGKDEKDEPIIEDVEIKEEDQSTTIGQPSSETSSTAAPSEAKTEKKKAPRKLVEEEKRAVGRISRDIWETYIWACGNKWYWLIFATALVLSALSPVAEKGWIRIWSQADLVGDETKGAGYYVGIYAIVTALGLVITTSQWFILYNGSIRASKRLYERLLESVLFADIRFHDTTSRGRLLNRFGKDFEGIDSSLSDNFGRSIMYGISAFVTTLTVTIVGGLPFLIAIFVLGALYYNVAKVYGQTSRDMRRLDSVTRSPLYSLYAETISGVAILRSFGASSKFLRDMLRCVDTNSNPYYWMWSVNRWLSARFTLLSSFLIAATGFVAVLNPAINASMAGFALAFASTITGDLLFLVRRFVGLEQSMVALERVREYTQVKRESAEFIEPRPDPSWPPAGKVECQDLVIQYAPDLPKVLHNLSFEIQPGEKVGILGRTGSGKSTLALSFFRFVEPSNGRILVDSVDISKIGLSDLRSRLTIIPQDPTILSGTLRNTLDVWGDYEDQYIFEALRRVHLIPSEDTPAEALDTVNANVFRDLDSPVSEGGENFSTGEKQLLCMARAILKRSKLLVMDEATASVDYATDELISKTIRQEFADSTILTIAHRLRTIIDYDRVMLLDEGRIVEFDKPATLLGDSTSKFHALCKATGKDEFAVLKKMAGLSVAQNL